MMRMVTLLMALAASAPAQVPETAADHLALAQAYHEKAVGHRRTQAEAWERADAYRERAAPDGKLGPNQWVRTMERRSDAVIAEADRLARAADEAAEFHRLRARELAGK